jgi:hypothetical protein
MHPAPQLRKGVAAVGFLQEGQPQEQEQHADPEGGADSPSDDQQQGGEVVGGIAHGGRTCGVYFAHGAWGCGLTTLLPPQPTPCPATLVPMPHHADRPTKICAGCGRPFQWRRKWKAVWDEVRWCSERCRRQGPRRSGREVSNDEGGQPTG